MRLGSQPAQTQVLTPASLNLKDLTKASYPNLRQSVFDTLTTHIALLLQEFNICFTTVKRPTDGSMPALPSGADGPGNPNGLAPLPTVIQGLVKRRREVKAQMKSCRYVAEPATLKWRMTHSMQRQVLGQELSVTISDSTTQVAPEVQLVC